VHCQ